MFDWFSRRKEAVAKNEESDNIRRLGFVKKWTDEELRILKDNLGSALDKIKQLLPDKTEDDIIEKINNLYKEPSGSFLYFN